MGGFWKWLELKREAGFGLKIFVSYTGWWLGTFFSPFSWEFHHPNWRTHIFQRGRYTTNQFFWVHVEVYEANSQPWDGLVTEVDSLLRYIIFWSWGLVTWNRSPKAPFGSNLCYPYKLYVRSYGIYQIHILYIYIYTHSFIYIYTWLVSAFLKQTLWDEHPWSKRPAKESGETNEWYELQMVIPVLLLWKTIVNGW